MDMSEKLAKPDMTAIQRQYRAMKTKHPEFLILFQVGDFYETFFEDAVTLSKLLGVALLTKRIDPGSEAIPMAGIPAHSIESYLRRLIAAGKRVAIAEYTGKAKPAAGVQS